MSYRRLEATLRETVGDADVRLNVEPPGDTGGCILKIEDSNETIEIEIPMAEMLLLRMQLAEAEIDGVKTEGTSELVEEADDDFL